jgi:hypothetical protein
MAPDPAVLRVPVVERVLKTPRTAVLAGHCDERQNSSSFSQPRRRPDPAGHDPGSGRYHRELPQLTVRIRPPASIPARHRRQQTPAAPPACGTTSSRPYPVTGNVAMAPWNHYLSPAQMPELQRSAQSSPASFALVTMISQRAIRVAA